MNTKNKKSGFTLLELLIVVAIMAILSVVMIIILDPAETLKKSRDSQRMSDLNTLKTALGIYLTATSSPQLDNYGAFCLDGGSAAKISYSVSGAACTTLTLTEGSDANGTFSDNACNSPSAANLNKVNGTGWIPVPFTGLTGGSPISNLPIDPINTITSATPTTTDLVYRYACQETGSGAKPGKAFELNARLESAAYGPSGSEDKSARDGGDNDGLYEVGSSVLLLGTPGGGY